MLKTYAASFYRLSEILQEAFGSDSNDYGFCEYLADYAHVSWGDALHTMVTVDFLCDVLTAGGVVDEWESLRKVLSSLYPTSLVDLEN